jgi:hypothetical protein
MQAQSTHAFGFTPLQTDGDTQILNTSQAKVRQMAAMTVVAMTMAAVTATGQYIPTNLQPKQTEIEFTNSYPTGIHS